MGRLDLRSLVLGGFLALAMARSGVADPVAAPAAGAAAVSGATWRIAPGAEPRIEHRTFTLANGLRVYVIEDHRSPMVHEVLWVRVGSKDEAPGRTGFAHLFEHLMFKGSAHIPDGKLDVLLEGAGGWSNAFTSSDMTVYQNVAAASFLERVLWIEADRLAGLLAGFDQAKLDNQRGVVLNERRQSYENEPYGQAELVLPGKLWPAGHGYHWPTIGTPEDLRAATVRDVAAFFRTYYVPQNATMVIAGAVRYDEVKRLVEKYFGWMPRAAEPPRPRYAAPAPLTAPVAIALTDDVQVPRVYLAWRGPAAYTSDEAPLDLALAILGGGKSSRLYRRLVYQDKVAQDVSAGLVAEELGGTVRIEVTAKPGVDPARLVRDLEAELARLAAQPPEALELARAQATYEAAFLGELESVLQRAITLAEYDVLARDPDYFAKDLARYRAVTPAAVQSAVARYLAPQRRVLLTIAPKGGNAP